MSSGETKEKALYGAGLAQKGFGGSNEAIITEGKGERKHLETRLKPLQFSPVSDLTFLVPKFP